MKGKTGYFSPPSALVVAVVPPRPVLQDVLCVALADAGVLVLHDLRLVLHAVVLAPPPPVGRALRRVDLHHHVLVVEVDAEQDWGAGFGLVSVHTLLRGGRRLEGDFGRGNGLFIVPGVFAVGAVSNCFPSSEGAQLNIFDIIGGIILGLLDLFVSRAGCGLGAQAQCGVK